MSTVEYQVTGMSCSHCERAIREEVEQIGGVTAVDVSAADGRLVVTADGVSDAAIVGAVAEAGYEASRV